MKSINLIPTRCILDGIHAVVLKKRTPEIALELFTYQIWG